MPLSSLRPSHHGQKAVVVFRRPVERDGGQAARVLSGTLRYEPLPDVPAMPPVWWLAVDVRHETALYDEYLVNLTADTVANVEVLA